MRTINYQHKNILFEALKDQVNLPKFQRSLVWNNENKRRFIDTVIKGDPFGVLLLYRDERTNSYIVIDGLQRYTTLVDFSKNPYKYLDFNESTSEKINEVVRVILQEYPDSGKDHIFNQISNVYKKVLNEYLLDKNKDFAYVPLNLYSNTVKTYGSLSEQAKSIINESFLNFWSEQVRNIDINKLEIPVIIYQGDFNNLPEIFERLNTGGTKLSKYEVYSSSWSNIMLKLITNKNNKRILNHIEKKYEELIEDTGIEITNFESDDIKRTGKITLYEYVYGLSKEIMTKARVLTNNRVVNYSRDDSIGFSTLASFHGLHLKDLGKLKNHITKDTTPLQFENLTTVVTNMFEKVSEILSPYISNNTKYIEAQVISIVHTYFRLNYEFLNGDIKRKPQDINLMNLFYKNMPMRMLYDVLNNYWSGSGDNKLFEIINNDLNNNRYLRPINEESWRNLLNDWVEEQNNKDLSTVPIEVRMFLSYITKKDDDIRYVRNTIIPKSSLDSDSNFGHLGNVFLAQKYKKFNRNSIIEKSDLLEDQFYIPTNILENPKEYYSKEEYSKIVNERSKDLINVFLKKYY